MERLQELITQLKEQFDRKADPSQMLQTTQLLATELQRLSSQPTAARTSTKVAVMMPSSLKIYTGQSATQEVKTVPAQWNGIPETQNGVPSESRNGVAEPKKEPVEFKNNGQEKNGSQETKPAPAVVVAPAMAATVAAGKETEKGTWPFDRFADKSERPSLVPPREVNDVIAANGSSSLNDKLRSDRLELKSALNDTPVRDLKKAIGVNDRYVFISQLFRGDEAMYERSLKTINSFRIFPEAEYWMERELMVKLGWDENREATKHFYQLVKRRFS